MTNYKINNQFFNSLSDEDRKFLYNVYLHRCLDEPIAYQFIYSKKNVQRDYCHLQIKIMEQNNVIEDVDYGEAYPALFLTSLGVQIVLRIQETIGENEEQAVHCTRALNAADLKIHEKNIAHQMHLNYFAMMFESYAKEVTLFKYYDGKFMIPVSNFMMPDGIIELPGCFLFLEMDMGTERVRRIAQKWDSYRLFLNAPASFYQGKQIIMLFILENIKQVEVRRNTIIASLFAYLPERINGRFEVYVDTAEKLHTILKNRILYRERKRCSDEQSVYINLQRNHGFLLSSPQFLEEIHAPISMYARKLNERKKVIIVGGKAQEFIVDIWLDGRLSILRNILSYEKVSAQIRRTVGRNLSYLVVVPDEKWIYRMLRVVAYKQPKNVYFTTPSRISACNWAEALFYIDQLGNLNHFTDASLKESVYEKRLDN